MRPPVWLLVLLLASAIPVYGNAQAQTPRQASAEVLLKRADALAADGQMARALAMYRRAVQRAPHDPTPVARFAALALPAVDAPEAVTPTDTVRADAEFVLVAIELVAQRDDSGVGDRAARLEGVRLWALVFARSLTEAIEQWRRREVLLSHDHAQLGRQLAALSIRREDLATAQALLRECVRLDPEDPTVRSDLAAVALARGNTSEALLLFREVAMANPGNLDAQRDLAGAYLSHGDALTAVSVLAANSRCSQECDCALELARAAITAKRHEVAILAAGQALQRCDASDPEPLLWLALSEQRAGRLPQARTAYRLALRRDPISPRALSGLQGLEGTPAEQRGAAVEQTAAPQALPTPTN